jgi:hypothetical protein
MFVGYFGQPNRLKAWQNLLQIGYIPETSAPSVVSPCRRFAFLAQRVEIALPRTT